MEKLPQISKYGIHISHFSIQSNPNPLDWTGLWIQRINPVHSIPWCWSEKYITVSVKTPSVSSLIKYSTSKLTGVQNDKSQFLNIWLVDLWLEPFTGQILGIQSNPPRLPKPISIHFRVFKANFLRTRPVSMCMNFTLIAYLMQKRTH